MVVYTVRACVIALFIGVLSAPVIADSTADREGLAAIARDLDILSEAVRRLELNNSGASAEGTRFRFDHLRIRIEALENTIRHYLADVESEPRRSWRVDVLQNSTERVHSTEKR